jgi:transposase InsO family protein
MIWAVAQVRGGVYRKGYADAREARAGIGSWIAFYNGRRPHQALGDRPRIGEQASPGRSGPILWT